MLVCAGPPGEFRVPGGLFAEGNRCGAAARLVPARLPALPFRLPGSVQAHSWPAVGGWRVRACAAASPVRPRSAALLPGCFHGKYAGRAWGRGGCTGAWQLTLWVRLWMRLRGIQVGGV